MSLRELSQRCGLSVFHLCRAFHELTGRTIAGYRRQLRLRAALNTVRDSTRQLTDIALDAGFYSHSHFTAVFKREFGVTPSAVRNGAKTKASDQTV
jgi:AraC family transcriptional regulator